MEKRNVPKLRFKGFEDEWIEYKLGNFLEFKNGINADKDDYGKGVKFINVLDILSNNYIIYDNIIGRVNIDDKTLEKYSVNYGDILFQRSSETREEVGTANVYLGDKTVTFGGFVIRGKKIGEYNPIFMNGLLKSKSARKEITTKSGGSTRYNVGQEILMDVNIKLPSLEEQSKIANFLSNVDNIIEEQEGKVKDLEQYKKGMMQKIFEQEVRFKDENGGEYPEWEEKKLGECIVCLDNMRKPLNSTERQEMKGNIPYYGANGIVDYINDFIFDERLILLAEDGGNFDEFATRPIAQIITGKSWINNHAHVLKAKDNYIDYIFYTLVHKDIREYINGTSRAKLNKSDMLDIKIDIPCIEEQTKIANFLSNIDNIIEEEKKKLEDLKLWKKGLLQQMFV
ncbi:restriction endonuclease subunit S [Clostridium baratii]|uniref:restriction endonuclease subunit S n=1 Tax=Clostridium baratii TaxID=1561 RepID=UPI001C21C6B3|nr:restriction endonuclease subunit S [Clostridium baratii]STA99776.1 Type I restriction modification DNA specificity domain [Clostridium baratii]